MRLAAAGSSVATEFLLLLMLVVAASVGTIGMLVGPVRGRFRSRLADGLNCTAICTSEGDCRNCC